MISYEPQPQKLNQANIYLNTAAHCFEAVNPLGLTELPLRKSNVSVGSSSAPAEAFVRPFQAKSRVKMPITFSRVEVLTDSAGKPTDAIRLLIGTQPTAQAEKRYLPTCDGYNSQAKDKSLHAMGWSASSDSLFVAAMRLEGLSSLPAHVLELFALGGEKPRVLQLTGVSSFPGESGGPVLQVDGREDVDRINGYECVRGIISRELAEPVLELPPFGAASTTMAFSLTVNSYFTPIVASEIGAQWKELK